MAEGAKAGSAYIEVGAKADKIRSDSKTVESVLKSEISRIERTVARIRPGVENTLVKKSIREIELLHTALKRQLETKIKLNADLGSVQRTQGVLKVVEEQLKDIKTQAGQSEKAVGGFFSKFGNLGSLIGFAGGAAAIGMLAKEAVMGAADLEVLRSNFEGTTEDLENFRRATAGTVSDASLIKLSNQATDLGISLKQQAILFSLAEDAGDKYGTSVEDGFQKIIAASEGNERGLRSLGIQREVYKSILQELAKVHGEEIQNLDAETQKQIRLEAILKASGVTLEDVKNKTKDVKDKLESIGVTAKDVLTKIGTMIIVTFEQIASRTESAWNMIKNKFGGGDIPTTDKLSTEQSDQLGKDALGNLNKGYVLPGQGFKEFAKENKKDSEVWTQKNKTVGQVEKRIEILVSAQKNLVLGSLEWLRNWREIEKLQKALQPPKESGTTYSGPVGDVNEKGLMKIPIGKKKMSQIGLPDTSEIDRYFDDMADKLQHTINLAESFSDTLASGFTDMIFRGASLKDIFEQLGMSLTQMVLKAVFFKDIMSSLGMGGGISILGLKSGGTVTNFGGGNVSYAPKFANGTDFVVPSRFTNDSFPMFVSAGERVSVTPANQVGNSFSDKAIVGELKNMQGRIEALTISAIKARNRPINLYMNSKLVGRILASELADLDRGNIKLGG